MNVEQFYQLRGQESFPNVFECVDGSHISQYLNLQTIILITTGKVFAPFCYKVSVTPKENLLIYIVDNQDQHMTLACDKIPQYIKN